MQTDIFKEDLAFFHQANHLIGDPLWLGQESGDKPSDATEGNIKVVHDKLALELGVEYLSPGFWYSESGGRRWANKYSYVNIVKNFLKQAWDKDKLDPNLFLKLRLSLVELAYAERYRQIQQMNAEFPAKLLAARMRQTQINRGLRVPGRVSDAVTAMNARLNDAWNVSVHELNERLRIASIKVHFHNGLLQFTDDDRSVCQIENPFWSVVSQPLWANVDLHMKEAFDKRDRGERDAVTPAMQALESAIKIICECRGWISGNEKGAAHFINHLVKERDGIRFIEVWEKDALIRLFGDIRNWFGHGPGTKPMPMLIPQQTNWALETSMVWIKSLVRRM